MYGASSQTTRTPGSRLSRRPMGLVYILFSLLACPAVGNVGQESFEWPVKTPGDAGLQAKPLAAMRQELKTSAQRNVHAVLLIRDGHLVFEAYFKGKDARMGVDLGEVRHDRNTLHDIRSCTKSVTALLVGIARDQGRIQGVKAPLLSFFPDIPLPDRAAKKGILLKHTLTMSAGLKWNEYVPYSDPENSEIQMIRSPDPVRYVLTREVVTPPGERFNYNGGLTELLARVVERRTRRPIDRFAAEHLWKPLGVKQVDWIKRGTLARAASGLRLTARDLARIGLLMLNRGKWNGKTLVSPEWIDACVTSGVDASTRQLKIGYGYQWRLPRYRNRKTRTELKMFWAHGNGGQNVLVIPSHGLILVTLAGHYNQWAGFTLPHELLTQYVFPAAGIDAVAVKP